MRLDILVGQIAAVWKLDTAAALELVETLARNRPFSLEDSARYVLLFALNGKKPGDLTEKGIAQYEAEIMLEYLDARWARKENLRR